MTDQKTRAQASSPQPSGETLLGGGFFVPAMTFDHITAILWSKGLGEYATTMSRNSVALPAENASAQDEGAATDDLVDRFAVALKAKLRAAGEKYGFDDAWKADDWRDKLIEDLWRHGQKGDPRDVAAYCAFAWHHQWSVSGEVFPGSGKNPYAPQDEGAAGEPVAKVVRKGFSTGSISWTKFGQDADLSDETPLFAHPSPTPAADADRVRKIVVDAVKAAMKDAWEDHASDTGCWPADIKRVSARGPLRLMFTPAIWAQTTAEWAAETVLAALKSKGK